MKIEKEIHINAPLERVWQALADTQEFGEWFGVKLHGPWVLDQPMKGTFKPITQGMMDEAQRKVGLEPAPIKQLPEVFCVVRALETNRRFAFEWTPYGLDAAADPANESMTLCEFFLEAKDGGTQLRIVESGFEGIPEHRRERAFRMDDNGWGQQAKRIKSHVEK